VWDSNWAESFQPVDIVEVESALAIRKVLAGRQGFELGAEPVSNTVMARDFWFQRPESQAVTTLCFVHCHPPSPHDSASVVETFWRRRLATVRTRGLGAGPFRSPGGDDARQDLIVTHGRTTRRIGRFSELVGCRARRPAACARTVLASRRLAREEHQLGCLRGLRHAPTRSMTATLRAGSPAIGNSFGDT
jgi:hypothetical protein